MLVRGDRARSPSARRSRARAPRPIAPAMSGVPASNLYGRVVLGALLEGDGEDHVAAALPRRHGREQLLAAVEHADAGGAVDLVAGEGVEVAVQRLHVDRRWAMACAPSSSTGTPRAWASRDDLARPGCTRAERVGDVRDRDQAACAG